MSLIAELKRRNVFRAGLAWLALSWLTVAMANLLFPALNLPVSSVRWLMVGLLVAWVGVLWLAWRYEWTGQGLRVDPGAGEPREENSRTGRRIDQATVVLVLAALSLSLLQQFLAPYAREREAARSAPAPAVEAPPPRPPGPVDPHSIAVLPFANLSPGNEDAYFADGLAEELLHVLARIDGLRVTSRSSSFLFRDTSIGTREIAARLGVAHLLEGSVRRQGEDVRITVQLIDAARDQQVWAQTYDRQLSDIFRVQEEISQAIADALASSLGVRTVQVAAATADLQAYEQYLRGRQLFVQRGANLPAARDLLEQAVVRDPDFADAWATLAGTWYVWRSYAPEPAGIDTLAEAQRAAERALALQPDHPGALAVSARLAADHGDRRRESELINRALAKESSNANTWLWKGLGQYEAGYLKAAHASFVQAQRLDPLNGLQLGWLGITTALAGDADTARVMLQQAHALGWRGPASRALFLMALNEGGDASQAYLAWLHDDETLPPSQREAARALAPALADHGEWAAAQARLAEAVAAHPEQEWTALLQVFGLTTQAMDAALRPEAAKRQVLQLILWDPVFAPLRAEPRFRELAESRGLVALWRDQGPPDGCVLHDEASALGFLECSQ